MIGFLIFASPGALILLTCCLVFLLKKTHGFWSYFLLGWTLEILLSLPAGIWQSLFGWPFLTVSGTPILARMLIPLMGWPFNSAGFSIRCVLWMLGKELYGSDSFFLGYMLLMYLQSSLLAMIFALRYKRYKTFRDWIIICLWFVFLINSLVNVNWYWGVG